MLDIRHLTVDFPKADPPATVVDDATVEVKAGEILALIGERGAGKSVIAKSAMRMNGSAQYGERSRVTLLTQAGPVQVLDLRTEDELRFVRGTAIAIAATDADAPLELTRALGPQLIAQVRLHHDHAKVPAREEAAAALERAGLSPAETYMRAKPSKLPKEMQRRAAIALALAGHPMVLILDDPFDGLDLLAQARLRSTIAGLVAPDLAILLLARDPRPIADIAHRIAVLYLGRVVEVGETAQVLSTPAHPYTRAFVAAVPRIDMPDTRPTPIRGATPSPDKRPSGCAFQTRCTENVSNLCRVARPLAAEVAVNHLSACVLARARVVRGPDEGHYG